MTALEKYIRLEALGQWCETEGAEPREVVVSFGDATLVLTDLAERPLEHWALAGVQTLGARDGATVFAMTAEGGQTLAIRDRDMIEAIGAVSRAHLHAVRGPVRTRRRIWPVWVAGVVLAGGLAAAPGAVRDLAARMVPPETVAAFGDEMLLQLMAAEGPLCAEPGGARALAALAARVAEGAPVAVRAMDLGSVPVMLLPGPAVVLGAEALRRAEEPAEVAGWIAVALARETAAAGAARLMAAAGPLASLRYVLNGTLSEAALGRALEAARSAPTPQEIGFAYGRLRSAGLATAPFADGLRRADLPAPPGTMDGATALGDQDWVALQGICG